MHVCTVRTVCIWYVGMDRNKQYANGVCATMYVYLLRLATLLQTNPDCFVPSIIVATAYYTGGKLSNSIVGLHYICTYSI